MHQLEERLYTECLYLFNVHDQAFIRTEPNNGQPRYWLKFQGKDIFESSMERSDVVMKAFMQPLEISSFEYESGGLLPESYNRLKQQDTFHPMSAVPLLI